MRVPAEKSMDEFQVDWRASRTLAFPRWAEHTARMPTPAEIAGLVSECRTGEIMRRVAVLCWDHCNAFLDWERDYALRNRPTAEVVQRHRQELKWLLRMVKLLHTMASDPEFPDPSVKGDFEALHARLNQSWQLVQEPGMSDPEADLILRECFPNGPGD